jgi:hypothetical protein
LWLVITKPTTAVSIAAAPGQKRDKARSLQYHAARHLQMSADWSAKLIDLWAAG